MLLSEEFEGFVELTAYCHAYEATGSRIICDPPPKEADNDWVLLVPLNSFCAFMEEAKELGYEVPESPKGGLYTGETVPLYRYQDNLIVTTNIKFYESFVAATHLARRLNIRNRENRIALFKALRVNL